MVNPVNPPGSLAVGMTHAPNPVFTGNYLTFLVTVTNLGPSGATNVLLTDTLPSGAALVSAAASQGTVNTNVAGVVTFNFGILTNAGDTATATIQVQPLQPGLASNSATVTNAAGAGATAVRHGYRHQCRALLPAGHQHRPQPETDARRLGRPELHHPGFHQSHLLDIPFHQHRHRRRRVQLSPTV